MIQKNNKSDICKKYFFGKQKLNKIFFQSVFKITLEAHVNNFLFID